METIHSICVRYFKVLMTLMDCNLKINQSININVYDKTVSINNFRVIMITYISSIHTLIHHISLFLPYFTIFWGNAFHLSRAVIDFEVSVLGNWEINFDDIFNFYFVKST